MDLGLSILASTIIFLLFKSFTHWKINTLQAVIANYFVAFACGMLLFQQHIPTTETLYIALPLAVGCGILFISLFLLMGFSSQRNGVSTTSVAVKMSMALSVASIIIINATPLNLVTVVSLILALTGVFFVSFSKSSRDYGASVWMLIVLFLGSACLDLVLFFVQNAWLPKNFHAGVFSALGFLMAGFIGSIYLLIQLSLKKVHFHLKSWAAGIALGIPNYFSIYLLVKSYSSSNLEPHQVLSIANVGVVVLSSVVGLLLFNEQFDSKKWLGLSISLLALLLFLFS